MRTWGLTSSSSPVSPVPVAALRATDFEWLVELNYRLSLDVLVRPRALNILCARTVLVLVQSDR